MINEILNQAKQFRVIIAELKRESSYYPSVLIKYYEKHEKPKENEREKTNRTIRTLVAGILKKPPEDAVIDKVCYASTLVRIKRNSKWYVVHCVESIILTKDCNEKHLLLRMMQSVYQIQLLYHISEITIHDGKSLQDIDNLQQSEIERLIKSGSYKNKWTAI